MHAVFCSFCSQTFWGQSSVIFIIIFMKNTGVNPKLIDQTDSDFS